MIRTATRAARQFAHNVASSLARVTAPAPVAPVRLAALTAPSPAWADADSHVDGERSPLSRYLYWQLRDFLRLRAPLIALVGLLPMYPAVMGRFGNPEDLRTYVWAVVGMISTVGALIATHGIASDDRTHGFHRFLFSKPINLARYYLQAFGASLAGVLGIAAGFGALYALLVSPFAVLPAAAVAVTGATLVGGLGFLASTLVRQGSVAVLGAFAATGYVQYLVEQHNYWWLAPVRALLIPFQAIGRMMEHLVEGQIAAGLAWAAWPLLYGAGAFALGLWVLRRRSMSA